MTSSTKFSPKRGRPNASQVAAIESAILEAAKNLFLSEGFDAVSMESVAQLAGVSKGTLYARYPAKKDLFEGFARANMAMWASRPLRRDAKMTDDIAGRLRFHAHCIAASLAEPELASFRRLIMSSSDKFPEISQVIYEAGYRYITGMITADVEAGAVRDGVPVKDANSVAETLFAGILGWFTQEGANREIKLPEIKQRADRVVELLMAARSAW